MAAEHVMVTPSLARDFQAVLRWRPLVRPVLLLAVVATLVFIAFSLLPADPIRAMVGVNASEEAVAALRHEFGYDRPWLARYGTYLWSLVRLDLGKSLVTRRPVGPELRRAYLVTVSYVGTALACSAVLSIALLCLGYFSPPPVGRALLCATDLVTSFPSLIVATGAGLIMVRSGIMAGIVPAERRGFVMAALALAVYPTFSLAEIAYRAARDSAASPASVALRSFGFGELSVFRLGVLRPALLPWLGHLSNVAAALVAGSVVVEAVFSLPGLGRLLVQSVLRGDLPMMQGIVLVSVVGFFVLDTTARTLADYLIGQVYR